VATIHRPDLLAALGSGVTPSIVVGVIVAALAWGAMFTLGPRLFWPRAAAAGALIGAYAVSTGPTRIGHLFTHGSWPVDVAIGAASGAALYLVFWIGQKLIERIVPPLAVEVKDLYAVRGATGRATMVVVLAVAASGEELFFRGLLQARIGFLLALAVYGAVHIWERKIILVLAALAGGAWWGALLSLTGGLVAPLVSHLTWCLMIIVWRPVGSLPSPRPDVVAPNQMGKREQPDPRPGSV
jgi:membrane protease YdiL (CAAX protease family)